jgi:two-component system chemotaxis response regulator CheB
VELTNAATPARLVAVGASAGGVEALISLCSGLDELPVPMLIVLHVPSTATSALPAILNRAGPNPARHATDGEPLLPGHLYVAPPDHHLLVEDGHARLTHGPRANGHRPGIDPLFESAARSAGAGTVAVLLSGVLDDGTAGSQAVHRAGGVVIVQDPADAAFGSMPANVVARDHPDLVLPVADIPAAILKYVAGRKEIRRAAGSLERADILRGIMKPMEPPGRNCWSLRE